MNEIVAAPAADALGAANLALQPARDPAELKQTTDHITRWRLRLEQAAKHDGIAHKRYEDDRRVLRGDTPWLVDTNLVQAIIEILMAFVYAKDPDIAVTCADSVGEARTKLYEPMTETLQIVVSRLLKKAGLKRKAQQWVRSAMGVGVGWLGATMQTRTEKDSLIQNEINDLKQQLDIIAALKAQLDAGDCADADRKASELQANLTALEAKAERVVVLGLALDLYPAEDILVAPECGALENYRDAPWIRKRLYKSAEEVQALTGWTPEFLKSANKYFQRARGADKPGSSGSAHFDWVKGQNSEAESVEGFYLVEEIWSLRDGVIYTLVDGIRDTWARAPYAPRQSSRFYDLFLLAFHYIEGERHPQSDVHMLKRLQDEYGRTRSNLAEHRKRAIPATVFDGTKINETEAQKLTNHDIGEYIALNLGDVEDMRKLFAPKSYAQFDPNLYNVEPILRDLEKVSGAQDAMQSGVTVEKTATEAEIQNNGFGARIGTRKDELEAVLSDLAQHIAELAMQALPEDYVKRLAGDNAIWPALSIDEILYGFNIEVKAGSTGKPNTAAQRQAWSTVMPLVEKIITTVGNFRAQGPQMEWAAKPYIELLRETLHRLDDKYNIDKLLPTPPPPTPAVDPVTGQPLPPGAQVDPATGQAVPAAPPMQPVLSATGGANLATPAVAPAAP